jgi:Uma2 family endonuclease
MTPRTEDRPQMSVEDFEELERRAPETVWLEFVNGKVVVKPMPDGNHSEIVAWLQTVCMQHRPDLWLHAERGLKTERYRKGRARADGVLVPRGSLKGHGEWSETEAALMAVEVTSWDSDAAQRDRVDKPNGLPPPESRSTSSSTGTTARSPCSLILKRAATASRSISRSVPRSRSRSQ